MPALPKTLLCCVLPLFAAANSGWCFAPPTAPGGEGDDALFPLKQLPVPDFGGLHVLAISLLLLAVYYAVVGFLYGRNPRISQSAPVMTPPEGIGPVEARVLRTMGFDHKALTVGMVSLAMKGWLTICQDKSDFVLRKRETAAPDDLRKRLLAALMPGTETSIADLANRLDVAPKHVRNEIAELAEAGYRFTETADAVCLLEKPAASPVAVKVMKRSGLQGMERSINRALFPGNREEVSITVHFQTLLQTVAGRLKDELRRHYEGTYYLTNRFYLTIGIIANIAAALYFVARIYGYGENAPAGCICFLVGYAFLISGIMRGWIKIFRGKAHRPVFMIVSMLLGTAICGGFAFIGICAMALIPIAIMVFLPIAIYGNIYMASQLKVPTAAGQQLLGQLQALRNFLTMTDDDWKLRTGLPPRTLETFEHYLPYALALDAEAAWAQRFADLPLPAPESEVRSHLAWIEGDTLRRLDLPALARRLGDLLTDAIYLAVNDANNQRVQGDE